MPTQHNLKWHPLMTTVLWLLLAGSFHMTPGQVHDVPIEAVSKNPVIDNTYLISTRTAYPSRGSKKLSPTAVRRAAIEQALQQGNEAREASDYEKAFLSYQNVVEKLDPKDPRAIYGLGNIYSDLSCTDQAIRAYNDALRLNKDFPDALIALGFTFITKERYEDAEAQFQAVFRKNPGHTAAKIGLAHTIAKKKRYDEALKQFHLLSDNRSIKEEDRALAYLYIGEMYLEQKKWEEAKYNFKKAIEHNRSLAGAYVRLGMAEIYSETSKFSLLALQEMRLEDRERVVKSAKKAIGLIQTAIVEHRYNHPLGHLLLAHVLLRQFNYREAVANIDEYNRKVKQLETDSTLLAANCANGFKLLYALGDTVLGLIYNQGAIFEKDEQKRSEYSSKVIQRATKIIEAEEANPLGYALLGQVYFRNGNYAEALQQFEKAILSEPNGDSKGGMLELIGICYEHLGHQKEAVRAYNEALKLRPNSTGARLALSNINEKNGNFDEAIRFKREALELTPEAPASLFWQLASSYYMRARRQNKDADYEEAIRLLKKALDLNESFGPAYLTLANVYKFYKKGAYADESLTNYQQAEKYAPKDAAIKLLIGDLFHAVKKNNEAAISYFEEAIKLKPDYAAAHWHLALVHRDKKNDEEAIKHLKTALNLDDKYQDAYWELADIYERQKNSDEAIKVWLKAADKLPLDYVPYKELARLYSYQQKNEEAIRYYEAAISRVKTDQEWFRDVLRCRIVRLRGQFADSIVCVQNIKLTDAADPAQIPYEIGLTHIASKNKEAALAQYEELKRRNSNLAQDLLRAINEMK